MASFYTKHDVWFFIFMNHKVRNMDLKEFFVDTGRLPNAILYNYLKELYKEKKIAKAFFDDPGYPYYYVPAEVEHEIKNLMSNDKFDYLINQMTEQEAKKMLKEFMHADI
jgi:hypothetical protein